MPFFPDSVMPSNIQRETSAEVDNAPNIFNARDYNIHNREIRAIQRYLVGDGVGSENNAGAYGTLLEIMNAFQSLSTNGGLMQFAGTVQPNQPIPMPAGVIHTTTSGNLLAGATTIPVVSTAGFPTKGFITKFNSTLGTLSGNFLNFSFGKSITTQEIISYTGITATSFTGCTRAVQGNAQDYTGTGNHPLIVSGQASLFLTNKAWAQDQVGSFVTQFFMEHDAGLATTTGIVSANPPAGNLTGRIERLIEVGYTLLVLSQFNDITV